VKTIDQSNIDQVFNVMINNNFIITI